MKSYDFWKYFETNPAGIALTCTLSGTGSATALLLPTGKIIVDASAAQAGKTITLTTPVAFKVLDAMSIHGDGTGCVFQLKNGSNALTTTVTVAGSDKDIDRATSVDDAYDDFATGDDDLVIAITSAAFTGRIIIDIQYT